MGLNFNMKFIMPFLLCPQVGCASEVFLLTENNLESKTRENLKQNKLIYTIISPELSQTVVAELARVALSLIPIIPVFIARDLLLKIFTKSSVDIT